MMNLKTRFMCAVLNCGEADLQILEHTLYDVIDIYQHTDAVDFNGIVEIIFEMGRAELVECYKELVASLSLNPKKNETELKELSEIDPMADIFWDIDYLSSDIYLDNYDVYKKYFPDKIIDIEANMGFDFNKN